MPSPKRGFGGVPQFPPTVPQVRHAYEVTGKRVISNQFVLMDGDAMVGCCPLCAHYLATGGSEDSLLAGRIVDALANHFGVDKNEVWWFTYGFDGPIKPPTDPPLRKARSAGRRARKYLNPETPDES